MKVVGVCACTVGIAHTYIAQEKLEKAAAKAGFEAKFETQGSIGVENQLTEQDIQEADVVLLGPQVRYLEATVKKEVAPTPAQLIDMRSYGRMDGAAVLKQAMDLIEANK